MAHMLCGGVGLAWVTDLADIAGPGSFLLAGRSQQDHGEGRGI